MGRELISVIIPIYKVEKYLARCVDGVLAQVYTELEIILVDDGSPDRCGEMCDEYARRDARVTVIHKPNGGLSDARNAGLAAAHGDYITFIDSDDYISEDHISGLYEALTEEQDCDISVCDYLYAYEEDAGIRTGPSPYRKMKAQAVMSAHDALADFIYQDHFDSASFAKLFRASVFAGITFPAGRVHEDVMTIYKAFLKSRRVVFSPRTTYFYVQRSGSILHNKNKPRSYYNDAAYVVESLKDGVCAAMPDLRKAVECRRYSMYAHIFINNYTVPENKDLADNAWQEMKHIRFIVMTDPHGRRKARLAALVSYFGKRLYYRLGTRHTNANSVST